MGLAPFAFAGLFLAFWITLGWLAAWRRRRDYGSLWLILGAGLGPLALLLPPLDPPVRCLFCGHRIPAGARKCPGCEGVEPGVHQKQR